MTPKGGGAVELKPCAMKFKETKSTVIHYRGEDLAANVHQHNTMPCVWIGEIARFREWDALASMPSFIVSIAVKKGSNMFVDESSSLSVHCFVCFGGGVI